MIESILAQIALSASGVTGGVKNAEDKVNSARNLVRGMGGKPTKSLFGLVDDKVAYYPIIATTSLGTNATDLADVIEARLAANIQIGLSGATRIIDVQDENSIIDFFKRNVADGKQSQDLDNVDMKWYANSSISAYKESENTEESATDKEILESMIMLSPILSKSFHRSNKLQKQDMKVRNSVVNTRTVFLNEKDEDVADAELEIADAAIDKKNVSANISFKQQEKRNNHMAPTVVSSTIMLKSGDRTIQTEISFGVKAVLHVVKSDDFVKAIASNSIKDTIALRLVKFTTGEIKFWKDLVFGIDTLKKVFNRTRHQKAFSMLNALKYSMMKINSENLSKQAQIVIRDGGSIENAAAGNYHTNSILPTTSLVITNEEVQEIEKLTGLDFSRAYDAKGLFEELNILSLYIADELNDKVIIIDRVSTDVAYGSSNQLYKLATSVTSLSGLKKSERDKSGLMKSMFKSMV
jgi:hypothetical protein